MGKNKKQIEKENFIIGEKKSRNSSRKKVEKVNSLFSLLPWNFNYQINHKRWKNQREIQSRSEVIGNYITEKYNRPIFNFILFIFASHFCSLL